MACRRLTGVISSAAEGLAVRSSRERFTCACHPEPSEGPASRASTKHRPAANRRGGYNARPRHSPLTSQVLCFGRIPVGGKRLATHSRQQALETTSHHRSLHLHSSNPDPAPDKAKPATAPKNGDGFHRFASAASNYLGSSWAFAAAVAIIVGWALTGPIYHYSNTWQLIINTGTTIVTFLMVFLIQNTQNRDARAINLKLNELIHAVDKAKNQMIDVENLSDEELKQLSAKYEKMREKLSERKSAKPVKE